MQKGIRQNIIREFIRSKKIGTQEELSELLDKEGVSATQSSVSRDLVELGIVKVGGIYALPETARRCEYFRTAKFGHRRK